MIVKQEDLDLEKKQDRKCYLAIFISAMMTFLGLVMGLICLKNGSPDQMFFCFSYCIIFLFVTIYTVKFRKLKVFSFFIKIFVIFAEVFYIKNGGSDGFGLVWITLVPFFSIYIFDTFNYYFLNGILLLLLYISLWTPIYQYVYDIGLAFRIRLPIIFTMEIAFGGFLRYNIEKTEKDLANQKNILSEEIKNAALIQKAFLSKKPQDYKMWSVGTKNVPMIGVTGDLYCVFDNNKKLDGLGLFDISGHGISSGLLTMLAKNTIEQQFYDNIDANGKEELWETVDKINKQIIEEKGEVQNYLTGILIKITDNRLELVNAGQPEPIIYRKKSNTFEFLRKDKNSVGAIGISDFPTFYISQYFEMESGDQLFLYTDGLTDCLNGKNEEFGSNRVIESLKRYINFSAEEQAEKIIADINKVRNKKINDDLTLMILKKN